MISERHPEIEDRAVPGHWEGDLITGSRNKSAIGTLVERTTRFTILPHLPDRHDAEHVQQAIIDKMASPPKLLRNSPTWDQGAELALHKRIGASLDMAVHFCDPHSPWQRGTNENTNGLLRQYFPKGTDPSFYPEDYPRRGRRGTQRPATQNPRVHETKREDHRTARRRVITSTTDNVTMEGRSNLRCCNHH